MSFNIIVLGDSIAWGQGLQDGDKYWNKVKDFVAPIVATDVVPHVFAHSGARIARDTSLDGGNPIWGEVPVSFPSIHAQLDQARKEVPADQPCIILLTGGINDIGLGNIFTVDPTISDKPSWIRKLVRENVGPRLLDLLNEITAAFPAGFVVVSSYFQIVSAESALNPTILMMTLIQPGIFLPVELALTALPSQAAAFDQQIRESFGEAVTAANSQREERVFFAATPWLPANSLGASQGCLWLGTDDPLWSRRRDFTTSALFNQIPRAAFTVVPLDTPVASLGHPNPRGAALFAQAIEDRVQQFREKIAPQVGAIYVSQNVPQSMLCGRVYPVSVTMKNTSQQTWNPPFRLGSQSPQDSQTWGKNRADLPGPVAPGAQAVFNFTVTAPATPGVYGFQWRMVEEGVQWFGAFTSWTRVSVDLARMKLQVIPKPPPLNRVVQVTVTATDSLTGNPITDGQIFIDGVNIGSTDGTSHPHIFRTKRIILHASGVNNPPDGTPEDIWPVGWVTRQGYATEPIDFGF